MIIFFKPILDKYEMRCYLFFKNKDQNPVKIIASENLV